METKNRVLGEEHPSTLISMGNLASTYRNQGWWKEAEELGCPYWSTCLDTPPQVPSFLSPLLVPPALQPPSTTLDSCTSMPGRPCWSVCPDAPPQVPSFLSLLLARLALRPPSTALDFCMSTLDWPC